MRVALSCGLVLAQVTLLASGITLRGVDIPDTDPPNVDATKNNLQINTAAAKISALKVKSEKSTANNAQAAAAQAATAKLHVEDIYVKTKAVMPELNAIKKVATKQAEVANSASKETVGLSKAMQKQKKQVIEDSKLLAVQEVKSLLKEKYGQLSDWRHNVLSNPWEKGQVSAAKAAAPYFKAMGGFAASQAVYGLEASTMKSQAAADAANAKSLAGGVDAKRAAGDPIGAAQDFQMAAALRTQSQQLAGRAATLQSQIAGMAVPMQQYAGSAHLAAWNAEYATNPDGVPPPPVDPNFAYNSPE